jgi:hypothetical protein
VLGSHGDEEEDMGTWPEQLAHGKDIAMEAMLFSLHVVVSC